MLSPSFHSSAFPPRVREPPHRKRADTARPSPRRKDCVAAEPTGRKSLKRRGFGELALPDRGHSVRAPREERAGVCTCVRACVWRKGWACLRAAVARAVPCTSRPVSTALTFSDQYVFVAPGETAQPLRRFLPRALSLRSFAFVGLAALGTFPARAVFRSYGADPTGVSRSESRGLGPRGPSTLC